MKAWVVRIKTGEVFEDRSVLMAYGFSGPDAESQAKAFAAANRDKLVDITVLVEQERDD